MSRKITAVLLLLLALAVCVTGSINTENAAAEMSATATAARDAALAENNEEAQKLCSRLENCWEGYRKTFCAYINHEHFDALDEAIGTLEYTASRGNCEYTAQCCTLIIERLSHLLMSEAINAENIF